MSFPDVDALYIVVWPHRSRDGGPFRVEAFTEMSAAEGRARRLRHSEGYKTVAVHHIAAPPRLHSHYMRSYSVDEEVGDE